MKLLRDFQGSKYYWEYYEDNDVNASYLFAYEQKTGKKVEDLRDGNAEYVYKLLLKFEVNKSEIDRLVTDKSELQIPSDEEIQQMITEHEEDELIRENG